MLLSFFNLLRGLLDLALLFRQATFELIQVAPLNDVILVLKLTLIGVLASFSKLAPIDFASVCILADAASIHRFRHVHTIYASQSALFLDLLSKIPSSYLALAELTFGHLTLAHLTVPALD